MTREWNVVANNGSYKKLKVAQLAMEKTMLVFLRNWIRNDEIRRRTKVADMARRIAPDEQGCADRCMVDLPVFALTVIRVSSAKQTTSIFGRRLPCRTQLYPRFHRRVPNIDPPSSYKSMELTVTLLGHLSRPSASRWLRDRGLKGCTDRSQLQKHYFIATFHLGSMPFDGRAKKRAPFSDTAFYSSFSYPYPTKWGGYNMFFISLW
jgi:hypothetical protein